MDKMVVHQGNIRRVCLRMKHIGNLDHRLFRDLVEMGEEISSSK